jgi:hypothetical protein
MFWRNMWPPSSRLKNKPSKIPAQKIELFMKECLNGIKFTVKINVSINALGCQNYGASCEYIISSSLWGNEVLFEAKTKSRLLYPVTSQVLRLRM